MATACLVCLGNTVAFSLWGLTGRSRSHWSELSRAWKLQAALEVVGCHLFNPLLPLTENSEKIWLNTFVENYYYFSRILDKGFNGGKLSNFDFCI